MWSKGNSSAEEEYLRERAMYDAMEYEDDDEDEDDDDE
jgi:hypothetical protein